MKEGGEMEKGMNKLQRRIVRLKNEIGLVTKVGKKKRRIAPEKQ